MRKPRFPTAQPQPGISWRLALTDLASDQRLLHFLVVAALVVGFFHGWLKLAYRHPATTFAFDALLTAAVVVCISSLPRGTSFFPKHPVTSAILGFYVLVLFYAFVPSGMPILARVANARGWCFPPLIFCLGYHLTKREKQIRGFFIVLISLGVITGFYGIRQSPEEIAQKMREDSYFAERYKGAAYGTESGKFAIRHFSTFVSAGAFGGVMAFVASIALVMLVDEKASRLQKAMLAGAVLTMCYGIILSGSRSPVVNLALSVAIILVFRRNLTVPLLLGVAGYLVLNWANEFTMGAAGDRFNTLTDKDVIGGRFSMPLQVSYLYLSEEPLGTGLGTSTYSIPFFMASSIPPSAVRPGEGDLCAVSVDMGILGVFMFYRIMWRVIQATFTYVKATSGRPDFVIPLAVATAIGPTVVASPIGSPFLGIPTGAVTWFFVGAMVKLGTMQSASTEHAEVDGQAGQRSRMPLRKPLQRLGSQPRRSSER